LAIFLEAYNEMRQDYSYGSERYVGGIGAEKEHGLV
jgi:hypothetical protein